MEERIKRSKKKKETRKLIKRWRRICVCVYILFFINGFMVLILTFHHALVAGSCSIYQICHILLPLSIYCPNISICKSEKEKINVKEKEKNLFSNRSEPCVSVCVCGSHITIVFVIPFTSTFFFSLSLCLSISILLYFYLYKLNSCSKSSDAINIYKMVTVFILFIYIYIIFVVYFIRKCSIKFIWYEYHERKMRQWNFYIPKFRPKTGHFSWSIISK